MRNKRLFCLFNLTLGLCFIFSALQINAKNPEAFRDFCVAGQKTTSSAFFKTIKTSSDGGGIREEIPDKYRERYEKWKNELLSTAFGREQWNLYAENKNFVLIIKIDGEVGNGAGTTDYQWNETGALVGATIVLGSKIDKGFPDPIYFPVVNSLSIDKPTYKLGENILAAAKFAHEFGHINQTAKTGGDVFRQQNQLISEYNEIFRSAGFGFSDARLVELQKKLGGTPVEIWENREYWGETNAMHFLLERLNGEEFFCPVVNRMQTNVKTFATDYEDRFLQIINDFGSCQK